MRVLVAAGLAFAAASALAQAADPLPRATPDSQGISSARLKRLSDAIQSDVEANRIAGAVVAIARNGRLVYHEAFGWQDKAAQVRMARDSIFAIASMTKPITATTALILQEEGVLHLNDPVGRYLPALEKMAVIEGRPEDATAPFKTVPAARQPTLQDLMRHTAGMTFGNRGEGELYKAWPQSGITSAENMAGEEFIGKLAALPLFYQPGTRWNYSLGFDVLGLAMEAAAKQPLEQVLRSRILDKVGMADTSFVLPQAKFARLAQPLNNAQGKRPNTYDPRGGVKFQCGGGCLVSTAGDYLRFYQMLLDGGRWNRQQVISRKSIEYMLSNHLRPDVNRSALDAYPNIEGADFGLGFAIRQGAGVQGVMGSPGEFHWHGATGSLAWVDPKERLIVVFLAHTSGPIRFENRKRVNAFVYQALE